MTQTAVALAVAHASAIAHDRDWRVDPMWHPNRLRLRASPARKATTTARRKEEGCLGVSRSSHGDTCKGSQHRSRCYGVPLTPLPDLAYTLRTTVWLSRRRMRCATAPRGFIRALQVPMASHSSNAFTSHALLRGVGTCSSIAAGARAPHRSFIDAIETPLQVSGSAVSPNAVLVMISHSTACKLPHGNGPSSPPPLRIPATSCGRR